MKNVNLKLTTNDLFLFSESLDIPVIYVDSEGVIKHGNTVFCDVFRLEQPQFAGEKLSSLFIEPAIGDNLPEYLENLSKTLLINALDVVIQTSFIVSATASFSLITCTDGELYSLSFSGIESKSTFNLSDFASFFGDSPKQEKYIIDIDLKQTVYINDFALFNLDYKKEEFYRLDFEQIGFFVRQISLQKSTLDIFYEVMEYGSATTFSIHRKKDGTEYPVETHLKLIVSDGKEYVAAKANSINQIYKPGSVCDKLGAPTKDVFDIMFDAHKKVQNTVLSTVQDKTLGILDSWKSPLSTLILQLADFKDAYSHNLFTEDYINKFVATTLSTYESCNRKLDELKSCLINISKSNKYLSTTEIRWVMKYFSEQEEQTGLYVNIDCKCMFCANSASPSPAYCKAHGCWQEGSPVDLRIFLIELLNIIQNQKEAAGIDKDTLTISNSFENSHLYINFTLENCTFDCAEIKMLLSNDFVYMHDNKELSAKGLILKTYLNHTMNGSLKFDENSSKALTIVLPAKINGQ